MAFLTLALLFVLPAGLDSNDSIDLGDAAHFYGVEVPAEAGLEDELTITLHYRTDVALEDDVHVFLHIQSQESACRIVRDEEPTADEDGWIVHEFRLTIPSSPACEPQRVEIYTGLYRRSGGRRFRVKGVSTTDDRIHAGYFDIVDGETTPSRTITPSSMRFQKVLSLANPFRFWGLGLLLAILLSAGLGRWMRSRNGDGDENGDGDKDEDGDEDDDEDENGDGDEDGDEDDDDDDDDPYGEDDDDES